MDQYLIYLRKSRADRDAEAHGDVDTLARHRFALLELAQRLELTVAGIYEEVVSGESVAARPEMQKLLLAVESGLYAGVLVMEVERLARGNTRDQGMVAETFQYSGTKIVTPGKIYDPRDEADQEYFEFGLFMSRREYKTINRRLQRGRNASLLEGKYIAAAAPYGYRRVKLSGQKGYTLEIDPEKAPVVGRIFSLYVHGERQSDLSVRRYGSAAIAGILTAESIPSPSGGKWHPSTVKDMLVNPTYAGMLRWSYRPTVHRMESGQRVTARPVDHSRQYLPGLHPPIIDRETWETAQAILSGRSHAPLPDSRKLRNPLAGLIYCAQCGRRMERRSYRHGSQVLLCPGKDCCCVSATLEEVERGVLDALRLWLADYRLERLPTPAREEKSEVVRTQERSVASLNAALSALLLQRERLCDLLEQGVYTAELFSRRSLALAEKTARTQTALNQANTRLQTEQQLETLRIPKLPESAQVLELYPLLETAEEKNELLRTLLRRVEYFKTDGGRWVPGNLHLAVFPSVRG